MGIAYCQPGSIRAATARRRGADASQLVPNFPRAVAKDRELGSNTHDPQGSRQVVVGDGTIRRSRSAVLTRARREGDDFGRAPGRDGRVPGRSVGDALMTQAADMPAVQPFHVITALGLVEQMGIKFYVEF